MALWWLGSLAAPEGRMPSFRPGALSRLGTLGLVRQPGPSLIASLGVWACVLTGWFAIGGLPRVPRGYELHARRAYAHHRD